MKLIRKAELKEVFQAWADSERKGFSYPSSLKNLDLLVQHQKNRCYIYGDLLFGNPVSACIVEIKKEDFKNIKFLKQVDENGNEGEPSSIKKWIAKNGTICDFYSQTWNFIGVRRPGKKKITLIDGLHRFSYFYSSQDFVYPNKRIPSLKGYIIETESKLREFE